jgi:hypothetical protein
MLRQHKVVLHSQHSRAQQHKELAELGPHSKEQQVLQVDSQQHKVALHSQHKVALHSQHKVALHSQHKVALHSQHSKDPLEAQQIKVQPLQQVDKKLNKMLTW